MTFGKWYRLYKHFQNYHDIKVKQVTYAELRKEAEQSQEWIS